MIKKINIIPCAALVILMLIATPAFAWYGSAKYATVQDVHLTDTYWWAREMGFNDSEAQSIAKNDDSVDMGLNFLIKPGILIGANFRVIQWIPGLNMLAKKWIRPKNI